jgi:hypothetical protein
MPRPLTRTQLLTAAYHRAVNQIDTSNPQAALVAYQRKRAAYERRRQQIALQAFLGSRVGGAR